MNPDYKHASKPICIIWQLHTEYGSNTVNFRAPFEHYTVSRDSVCHLKLARFFRGPPPLEPRVNLTAFSRKILGADREAGGIVAQRFGTELCCKQFWRNSVAQLSGATKWRNDH